LGKITIRHLKKKPKKLCNEDLSRPKQLKQAKCSNASCAFSKKKNKKKLQINEKNSRFSLKAEALHHFETLPHFETLKLEQPLSLWPVGASILGQQAKL